MKQVFDLEVTTRVQLPTGLDAARLERLLQAAALLVLADAKKRCPVRYGHLRNSGEAKHSGFLEWAVTFGGPAAPYAVFVHEDLKAHHRVGEAKFLEKALPRAVEFLESFR